jgi:hypothetical protein
MPSQRIVPLKCPESIPGLDGGPALNGVARGRFRRGRSDLRAHQGYRADLWADEEKAELRQQVLKRH